MLGQNPLVSGNFENEIGKTCSPTEIQKPPHYTFVNHGSISLEEFYGLGSEKLGEQFKLFEQMIPDERIVWHYYYRDMDNGHFICGHSITVTNYARVFYSASADYKNYETKYIAYNFWISTCFILRLQKIYDMKNSYTGAEKKIPLEFIKDYLLKIKNPDTNSPNPLLENDFEEDLIRNCMDQDIQEPSNYTFAGHPNISLSEFHRIGSSYWDIF